MKKIEDKNLDGGLLATSDDISQAARNRRVLEKNSSDPELSAWELLVRPNRSHANATFTKEQRRSIGALALSRYCDGGSLEPHSYRDLLPDDDSLT